MDEGTTRSSVLDERLRDPTQITWPPEWPSVCSIRSVIPFDLVGRTGFEPVTFSVSGRRAPAAPTARDDESLPDSPAASEPSCQAAVTTTSWAGGRSRYASVGSYPGPE